MNNYYAGTITKAGAAQCTFNNANGSVTKFVFNAGVAAFANPSRFGVGANNAAFLTFNGGTVSFNTTTAWTMGKSVTVNSGGGTIAPSSATITVTQDQPITWNSGNLTVNTSPLVLSSASSSGNGTLTANTATTLNAANVLGGSGVVLAGTGTVTFNNNNQTVKTVSRSGALTLGSATLTIANPAGETASGTVTSSGGGLTKNGTGTWTASGSLSGFTGAITISSSGGKLSLAPGTGYTLGATSVSVGSGATFDASPTGTATLTIGTAISGAGAMSVNAASGAIVTLSADNSGLTGGLSFNSGRINFNNNNAAGTGTINVGASAAQFVCTSGTVAIGNAIALASGANPLMYATTGNTLEQTGVISGAGGFTRDDTGAGTLKLSGANTFNGGFTVKSRGMRLNNKQAVGAGTFTIGDPVTAPANAISITADAALTGANAIANTTTWNQDFTLAAVNSMELSGSVTMNGARTATVNSGVTLTLSGIVGGGTGLTKAGLGTLTLTRANTYGGNTIVSGGKLLVNNTTGSGTSSGTITVQTGGTLGGSGFITGAVTVQPGGTLAPGNSISTLTLSSSPSLSGATVMEIDKSASPNADKLAVSGALSYTGGTLAVNNIGPALTGGETFDLFDATSFSGAFTSMTFPTLGAGLNWWTGRLTVDGTINVNRAPSGVDKSYSRAADTSLKIAKADLLVGATDPDSGDAPTSTALAGTGSQGATVTENGGYIFYSPVNNNNDTIQFSVADARGGLATNNIAITVVNPGGIGKEIAWSPSGVTVTFAGIPGLSYAVERAEDTAFTVNLTTLTTTNAPAAGIFSIFDPSPPTPSGFYRTKH
jgi:autotransporter-associated beta strand protein